MSKGQPEIYTGRDWQRQPSLWVTLLFLASTLLPVLSAADRPKDVVVDVRNRAREASKSMRAGDVKLEAGDVAGACQDYTRTLERSHPGGYRTWRWCAVGAFWGIQQRRCWTTPCLPLTQDPEFQRLICS